MMYRFRASMLSEAPASWAEALQLELADAL